MTTQLRAVAILAHHLTAETIRRAAKSLPGINMAVTKAEDDLSPHAEADIMLYELVDAGDAALARLAAAAEGMEQATLIVIAPTDDALLIRRLMRLGARDIIASPVVDAELVSTLEALLSEQQSRQQKAAGKDGKVVVFFSAKGSSGSTFLSVNTACSIAYRHGTEAALLDMDLQFGNTSLLLDIKPENTILDALKDAERLDGVFLSALMAEHGSGLSVLPSPGNMGSVKDISPVAVRRLLQTAKQRYDITIVDLPRLISAWTLEIMGQADHVFVVMQNNLSALRDAALLLEFLPRQGVAAEKIEVINNRAMSNSASASIEQIKQTLKRKRIRRIRNDYMAASMAEDKGQAIIKSAPQSKLSEDINALADYLGAQDVERVESKEGKSWLNRLINR